MDDHPFSVTRASGNCTRPVIGDGFSPDHADKLTRILARLDVAMKPNNMDLPGFRLHPLKGDRAGYWAIRVSRNWRVVFRFEGGDATDVDLIDYH